MNCLTDVYAAESVKLIADNTLFDLGDQAENFFDKKSPLASYTDLLLRLSILLDFDIYLLWGIKHKKKLQHFDVINKQIECETILKKPLPNVKSIVIGHNIIAARYFIQNEEPQQSEHYASMLRELMVQWKDEFQEYKDYKLYLNYLLTLSKAHRIHKNDPLAIPYIKLSFDTIQMLYQRKRFTVLECLTELEDITKEAELCLTKLKLMPEATAWKGMNLIINSTVKRLGSKAQDENVNELFWIMNHKEEMIPALNKIIGLGSW